MAGTRKPRYRTTEGWEEDLVPATSAIDRIVAKAHQQGEFTFGNRRDVRYYADRLRRAAAELDQIHDTYTTPTERPERFVRTN